MAIVRPGLIELRQYIIAPGQRGRMVALFDTQFVDAQDALGLPILGHFTAVDEPDKLVWIRGFSDMESRPEKLGAFYGGPVWREYGAEAIALVTGYDNVQLLREAIPGSGIEIDVATRPAPGEAGRQGHFTATTYRLKEEASFAFIALFQKLLLAADAVQCLGSYVSETAANNFPVLPIREGEHLFTWIGRGAELALPEAEMAPYFSAPPERLTLIPCARSALQ